MYAWIFDKKYLNRFIQHAVIFAILCAVIVFVSLKRLPLKLEVHWLTIINFSFLTCISYAFFAINNVYAKKIKAQSLPFGFFLSFLGFAFLTLGLVFQSSGDVLVILASCFGAIGFSVTAYGTLKWVQYSMKVKRKIRSKTEQDQLTGLYSRRALATHARNEKRFAENTDSALSLLLIDIDNFKPVNDIHGHDVGDLVIRKLSALLKDKIRKTDNAYRWGGEEFMVILPVTDLDEAFGVASKLLISAEEISVGTTDTQINITVSIGVAQWCRGESLTVETFKRADKALLAAKNTGKNKVVKA
ncbi:GGDEF domain-containing protein [Marinicella rhabdoformis]|uniref:GGDEF domain-containing protein n=1 Tax=Marinicella rhabdoformis TaxID=2580566 RepID=UPI0012AEC905|nr:GGDEF domain-containing protein [Marinicella rhabdoformis]